MMRMSDDLIRVQEHLDYWLEDGGDAQELEEKIKAETANEVIKLGALTGNPRRAMKSVSRIMLYYSALAHLQDWVDAHKEIDPDKPVVDLASLMLEFATWAGGVAGDKTLVGVQTTPENFLQHYYVTHNKLPPRKTAEEFLSQFYTMTKVRDITMRWVWEDTKYPVQYIRVDPKPVYIPFTDGQLVTRAGILARLDVLGLDSPAYWSRQLKAGNFAYKQVAEAEVEKAGWPTSPENEEE